MIRNDRRTDEQQQTHVWLVVGTDSFMSGWGEAKNGASYAAWACRFEDSNKVLDWVERRDEMKRVRVVKDCPGKRYRPNPNVCAHLSIYPVDAGHPALTS